MKKMMIMLVFVFSSFFTSVVFGADINNPDPQQFFYNANREYEKGDYEASARLYEGMLERGLESGSLYYNLGNSFLKLGKVGNAILYYKKALRLIPRDGDLKANLIYARSLAGSSIQNLSGKYYVVSAVSGLFSDLSLRAVILSGSILYLIVIGMCSFFILKPFFARRFRVIFILVLVMFFVNLIGAGFKFYDQNIFKHCVVLQKKAEVKYEPIDKSTTHYTLQEGDEVYLLNSRNGWSQICRGDGKIGWVKRSAIGVV